MLPVGKLMKQAENSLYDTVIAGGGIAGLVCALELLEHGQQVIIVDRDTPERIGGLARWAFGGMALSGTSEQKKMNIIDNPQQLYQDWCSFAEFEDNDNWPKAWAKEYAEHNYSKVYCWLKGLGIKFLPAVNWVERGLYVPGNSVPRYHVIWGTGWHLVETLINRLSPYIHSQQLSIIYQHKVLSCDVENTKKPSLNVINEQTNDTFTIEAKNIVIACGGINGSTERVKKNWYKPWGEPPQSLLNGANPISDGKLHDNVEQLGAEVTHVDNMWNYAAGIRHPQAEFSGHGLSLIPCKSALWLDHLGKRIGPMPLVTGFDTNFLCQQVAKQEKPWTWQILNWNIAKKELAVSGSVHNPSIRDKKLLTFLKEILLGNTRLVNQLIAESDDVVCAHSIDELVKKMNEVTDESYIDEQLITEQIALFDKQLSRDSSVQNDDQIRRILHARQWRPDKLRTCKPAPIVNNPEKNQLIAIRLQLISRKSLGGVKTNTFSQVLKQNDDVINGLYCIGEAAGFGGGGASGRRSLEGTFLSGCILTARNAAQHIVEKSFNNEKTDQKQSEKS